MLTVTALKLEEWSESTAARAELPRWIARLIWASCDRLTTLEMPGGEHGQLAGFDGVVECDVGNDLVPAGVSAWELSVDSDIKGKADEDFEKRDSDSAPLNKPDVTFVFATPRRFAKSQEWAGSKAGRGWKGVKVIWSSHMERWFERVPWLATAFLADLGESPVGFESLGMVWSAYENAGAAKKLGAEFVIGDRLGVAASFINWLNGSSSDVDRTIRVTGGSHREVLHYLAACVRLRPESERTPWESRLFAVQTEDAARSLRKLNASHVILVPGGPAMPHVLRAQGRSGCRVVIMDTTEDTRVQPAPGIKCIRLDSVPQGIWVRSLVGAGFSEEDAARLCQDCQCDYERLRRSAFIY